MNILMGYLVCVLGPGAAANETGKKTQEGETVIARDVDATGSLFLQGIIFRKEISSDCDIGCLEIAITNIRALMNSGAFSSTIKDRQLLDKASKITLCIPDMQQQRIPVTKHVPVNMFVVAEFSLYLAGHTQGGIGVNNKHEVYYRQTSVDYSGYAFVIYKNNFETSNVDLESNRLFAVIDSFTPLAKKLGCQVIWVRAGERLGAAWSVGLGWPQIVTMNSSQGKQD